MISIFRQIRLVNEMVILDQFRIPLIGLTAHESIETIITQTKRPSFLRSANTKGIHGYIVILADPECTPSCIMQYTSDCSMLQWYMTVITRKTRRGFGDRPITILM